MGRWKGSLCPLAWPRKLWSWMNLPGDPAPFCGLEEACQHREGASCRNQTPQASSVPCVCRLCCVVFLCEEGGRLFVACFIKNKNELILLAFASFLGWLPRKPLGQTSFPAHTNEVRGAGQEGGPNVAMSWHCALLRRH